MRRHKTEQRWFSVADGSFAIGLAKIDYWLQSSKDSPISVNSFLMQICRRLHIPCGCAAAIQDLEEHSKMIIFADHHLDHLKEDDYLYPEDYFFNH